MAWPWWGGSSAVTKSASCASSLVLHQHVGALRIIQDDTRIRGLLIGSTRHKMSVYADDSTLVARINSALGHSHVPFFDENLATY